MAKLSCACGCTEFFGEEYGNIQCTKCGDWYNHSPFGLDFICHDKLPYIKNNLTGEEEVFPSIGAAIEEAESRNRSIIPSSTATALSLCEHWLAFDGKETLLTDDVSMWRQFHPDRALV